MTVTTKKSVYQFDGEMGLYRKIKPSLEDWKTYYGFVKDPTIGSPLLIMRDENKITITSTVINIHHSND